MNNNIKFNPFNNNNNNNNSLFIQNKHKPFSGNPLKYTKNINLNYTQK